MDMDRLWIFFFSILTCQSSGCPGQCLGWPNAFGWPPGMSRGLPLWRHSGLARHSWPNHSEKGLSILKGRISGCPVAGCPFKRDAPRPWLSFNSRHPACPRPSAGCPPPAASQCPSAGSPRQRARPSRPLGPRCPSRPVCSGSGCPC